MLNNILGTSETAEASETEVPAPIVSDAPPLIDQARLDELLAVLPKDVFAQMSEQFIDSTDEYIATLGEAISSGDAEVARRTAHAVKGVALNFGAVAIAGLASEIESDARETGTSGVGDAFDQLKDAATKSRIELLDKISRL